MGKKSESRKRLLAVGYFSAVEKIQIIPRAAGARATEWSARETDVIAFQPPGKECEAEAKRVACLETYGTNNGTTSNHLQIKHC
jgi:hypothetical protein